MQPSIANTNFAMSLERYRPVCNDVEMFLLYNYEITKEKHTAAKKDMKKADEEYMKAEENYYDKKLALEQITAKKDSDSKLVKKIKKNGSMRLAAAKAKATAKRVLDNIAVHVDKDGYPMGPEEVD